MSAAEEMRRRVTEGIAAAARRDRLGDNHHAVAWERPGMAEVGELLASDEVAVNGSSSGGGGGGSARGFGGGSAGGGGRAADAAAAAARRDMMISVIAGEASGTSVAGDGAYADGGAVPLGSLSDAAHAAAIFAPPAALAAAAARAAAASAAREWRAEAEAAGGAAVSESARERGRPVHERVQLGDEVEALYRDDGGWYPAVVISVTHGGYTNAEYKVCALRVVVGGVGVSASFVRRVMDGNRSLVGSIAASCCVCACLIRDRFMRAPLALI
jgi:hypothetical protein